MPSWFGRNLDCVRSVFFRGSSPSHAENLTSLSRYDIETRAR